MANLFLLILIGSILITVSIVASNLFVRLGVPTLLVGLALGIVLSNSNIGGLAEISAVVTLRLGEIALCIIIFAGGFETNFHRIRGSFRAGIVLSTLGVILTSLTVGLITMIIFQFDPLFSFLLGAIISSTDAATVFSIFDQESDMFTNEIDNVIQIESGANDPMAYFLVIFLATAINTNSLRFDFLVIFLFQNIVIAILTALVMVKVLAFIYDTFTLKQGQSPILLLSFILILYGINGGLNGSYFLAVYIFGLLLDKERLPQREPNLYFYESISLLMETFLFIILGYQVFIDQLIGYLWMGLVITFILIVLARPMGVILSLYPFKTYSSRELGFISWVGLRGATPIVFGLIPIVMEVANASALFDIAFIVVILSLLIQGTTVNKIADLLGVREKPVN